MLGALHLHKDDYEIARNIFENILSFPDISQKESLICNVYLAAINYKKGEISEALKIIRPLIDLKSGNTDNFALAYASEIYMKAGIYDTAYIYSDILVHSKKQENRKTGYKVMLSPELRCYIPADSIDMYFDEYKNIIEEYLDRNGAQAALIQNSFYNYSLHEKERFEAEKTASEFGIGIYILIILLILIVSSAIYIDSRKNRRILKLMEALERMRQLNNSLATKNAIQKDDQKIIKTENAFKGALDKGGNLENSDEIRKLLHKEFDKLLKTCSLNPTVNPEIVGSEAYSLLRERINNGGSLPENDPLWIELAKVVEKVSENFKYRLELLMGYRPKLQDYHVALLMKCGVRHGEMCNLLCRTKSTISYQRQRLIQNKYFNGIINSKNIGDILLAL